MDERLDGFRSADPVSVTTLPPKPNRRTAGGTRLSGRAGNVILNGNGCPSPPPFPLCLSPLLSPSTTPTSPPLLVRFLSHTLSLSLLFNRLLSRI